MNVDTNIQVWLETVAQTPPGIIVPYVRTVKDETLRYQVRAVRTGPSGRSTLTQGGTIQTRGGIAAALGRMSVSRQPNDDCNIDVVLSEDNAGDRNYHFACPD